MAIPSLSFSILNTMRTGESTVKIKVLVVSLFAYRFQLVLIRYDLIFRVQACTRTPTFVSARSHFKVAPIHRRPSPDGIGLTNSSPCLAHCAGGEDRGSCSMPASPWRSSLCMPVSKSPLRTKFGLSSAITLPAQRKIKRKSHWKRISPFGSAGEQRTPAPDLTPQVTRSTGTVAPAAQAITGIINSDERTYYA